MAEKSKRRRKWWLWVAACLMTLITLVMYFLFAWEDPRYTRAAAGFEAARTEARNVIGPLTWAEYREEHGYEHQDHSDEWTDIRQNLPQGLEDIVYGRYHVTPDSLRQIDKAKDWIDSKTEYWPSESSALVKTTIVILNPGNA